MKANSGSQDQAERATETFASEELLGRIASWRAAAYSEVGGDARRLQQRLELAAALGRQSVVAAAHVLAADEDLRGGAGGGEGGLINGEGAPGAAGVARRTGMPPLGDTPWLR